MNVDKLFEVRTRAIKIILQSIKEDAYRALKCHPKSFYHITWTNTLDEIQSYYDGLEEASDDGKVGVDEFASVLGDYLDEVNWNHGFNGDDGMNEVQVRCIMYVSERVLLDLEKTMMYNTDLNFWRD